MPANLPVPSWKRDNHPGRVPCYQRRVFGNCLRCNSVNRCTGMHIEAEHLDDDFMAEFCAHVGGCYSGCD